MEQKNIQDIVNIISGIMDDDSLTKQQKKNISFVLFYLLRSTIDRNNAVLDLLLKNMRDK